MGFKHRDITKQKVFARTEEIYATRGFEESCKFIRLQNQREALSWFARNEDETPHKKHGLAWHLRQRQSVLFVAVTKDLQKYLLAA